MDKKDRFSLWLAVFGTFFELAPIVVAIVFSVIHLIQAGFYMIDFLTPAELFPLILIGSALLIWASIRARSRRGLIIASIAIGLILLIGGQIAAVASGIASGATEPTGFWFGVILGTIIVFDLAVIATAVGGILLSLELFKRTMPEIPEK
jgi:hypothetical protein